MRQSWIPPRRPGPLPEILLAEHDEILSSWLTRLAALYRARPETLLEQLGISEVVPAVLDRRAFPTDLERLSIAVRSSPEAIRRMTFTDETPEALEFVAHRFPLWTCRRCASEFVGRDLAQARLRTWFIAVASRCRRCGGQLTSVRARTSRALRSIIADGEPYEIHARGTRQARPRIRNRTSSRCGHARDEGAGGSRTNRYAGSLCRPQSGTPAVRPPSGASAPVATRRNAETAATYAWIPVLASA
jgi:hypothetical protein